MYPSLSIPGDEVVAGMHFRVLPFLGMVCGERMWSEHLATFQLWHFLDYMLHPPTLTATISHFKISPRLDETPERDSSYILHMQLHVCHFYEEIKSKQAHGCDGHRGVSKFIT